MPREIMNEAPSDVDNVVIAWGWDLKDGKYPLATIEVAGNSVPLEWEDMHRFVRVSRRIIKSYLKQVNKK
jgi:hypothetical protein